MVISLLLGFFGIIVSVVGMKCTKVGEEDPVTKSRIAVAGGVLFILSGKWLGRSSPWVLALLRCKRAQTAFKDLLAEKGKRERFGDGLGVADVQCLMSRSVYVSSCVPVCNTGHLRVLQCQHPDQRKVGLYPQPEGHSLVPSLSPTYLHVLWVWARCWAGRCACSQGRTGAVPVPPCSCDTTKVLPALSVLVLSS